MTDERPPPVLALFGPTASGKSAVAEAIAERVRAEIVSADAMQVYRGLPILTNQPARATRLVAVWPLEHEGSVGEYQALAHAAIDELLAAGVVPIVAGGTGLYLRAALADLAVPPPPAPGARARLDGLYERLGPEQAHAALARRDPAAAAAVHPRDRRRVVRALELAETGGSLRPSPYRLWGEDVRRPAVVFGLDPPRGLLAARIERRARAMFERGVEDEVAAALRQPLSATARKIMGLREVAELPPAEALEALVARTRRYAAYQRKWMRRIPGLVRLRADRPAGEIADEILAVARLRELPGASREQSASPRFPTRHPS